MEKSITNTLVIPSNSLVIPRRGPLGLPDGVTAWSPRGRDRTVEDYTDSLTKVTGPIVPAYLPISLTIWVIGQSG